MHSTLQCCLMNEFARDVTHKSRLSQKSSYFCFARKDRWKGGSRVQLDLELVVEVELDSDDAPSERVTRRHLAYAITEWNREKVKDTPLYQDA
jgi:hypothetical protein